MSIKTLSVLAPATVLLSIILAGSIAIADEPVGQLTGAIDYTFVGHLEQIDDDGRLLVWEATIKGDIAGEMKWWFGNPPAVSSEEYLGGSVKYYVARWEIRVGEKLVLAGESAGKTVFPDSADGMWDGHGVVTEAYGDFKALLGRNISETGPVIMGPNPPQSFSGAGMFQIY